MAKPQTHILQFAHVMPTVWTNTTYHMVGYDHGQNVPGYANISLGFAPEGVLMLVRAAPEYSDRGNFGHDPDEEIQSVELLFYPQGSPVFVAAWSYDLKLSQCDARDYYGDSDESEIDESFDPDNEYHRYTQIENATDALVHAIKDNWVEAVEKWEALKALS